jgi:hypothetical protein
MQFIKKIFGWKEKKEEDIFKNSSETKVDEN